MPIESRFTIAKEDIKKHFDSLNQSIFTVEELRTIFRKNRVFWRLAKSWENSDFIYALLNQTNKLKKFSFEFDNRTQTRYIWGKEPSPFKMALSIHNGAYLSHYSAFYFYNLTDQIPKTVYISQEQSEKKAKTNSELTQNGIDRAFSKPQRLSRNISQLESGEAVCLLHGKYTDDLGVENLEGGTRVTGLERSLIDATVRPLYCGGVYEVLEAYKRAAPDISVNRLTAYLRKINYLYPYHQAIGLYMEKSGAYKDKQIALLKRFDFQFDFYLTYNMKEMEYSENWRIYHPKGF